MDGTEVVLLCDAPHLIDACADLLNSEWPRSKAARCASLSKCVSTGGRLPCALLLLEDGVLVGHCRICVVEGDEEGCWVESLVIDASRRGRGLGKHLMLHTEQHARQSLGYKRCYLMTRDQQRFYHKLGYVPGPRVCSLGVHSNLINSPLYDKLKGKLAATVVPKHPAPTGNGIMPGSASLPPAPPNMPPTPPDMPPAPPDMPPAPPSMPPTNKKIDKDWKMDSCTYMVKHFT